MGKACLRFGRDLGDFCSYRPPGASYTGQGPQKQPEIIKKQLFIFQTIQTYPVIFPYIPFSRALYATQAPHLSILIRWRGALHFGLLLPSWGISGPFHSGTCQQHRQSDAPQKRGYVALHGLLCGPKKGNITEYEGVPAICCLNSSSWCRVMTNVLSKLTIKEATATLMWAQEAEDCVFHTCHQRHYEGIRNVCLMFGTCHKGCICSSSNMHWQKYIPNAFKHIA